MMRSALISSLLFLAGCAGGPAAGPNLAEAPAQGDVFYGKQVAERSCGGCHAVADGPGRMDGAPAFADLYRRHDKGGLRRILEEGMILPSGRMQDEGSRYTHPRMPGVVLGDDEAAALIAYLRSLEPAR
jgi:mono/diheme cytochrome c family protein